MSLREEQCKKVCRILDDVLANRPTERDSLIVAVRKAFESLEQFGNSEPLPSAQPKRGKWIKTARWGRVYYCDQCRNYLDFDGVNAGRGSTNFCPNCGSYNGGENEI